MRFYLLFLLSFSIADIEANVLSSIKPIDLIVSDIAGADIASSVLLSSATSPHHYALTVRDAQLIATSDLVIWIGPALETFLQRSISRRAGKTLTLLEQRDHHQAESHHHHDHHEHSTDAHIWLAYENAIDIASAVAEALSDLYPEHRGAFAERLAQFTLNMQREKAEAKRLLEPVSALPFGVYHDGYNAFVEEFELNQVAHVTLMPDEQLSAKQLFQLRQQLSDAQCLLGEVQESAVVERVAAKLGVRSVSIDLLAARVENSNEASGFARYMRSVRDSFLACLNG